MSRCKFPCTYWSQRILSTLFYHSLPSFFKTDFLTDSGALLGAASPSSPTVSPSSSVFVTGLCGNGFMALYMRNKCSYLLSHHLCSYNFDSLVKCFKMNTSKRIFKNKYENVCCFLCMHANTFTSMYNHICMYVRIFTHTHICTYIHTNIWAEIKGEKTCMFVCLYVIRIVLLRYFLIFFVCFDFFCLSGVFFWETERKNMELGGKEVWKTL